MTEVSPSDRDVRGPSEEHERATSPGSERSGGRRLLVGYGFVLTVSGLVLAGEPEQDRGWRTLGIVAAVIGLVCMLAPMMRRPVGGPPAVVEPTPEASRTKPEPTPVATSAADAELDRLAAELAEAQGRLDLRAAELAIEQSRLDERVAELANRRHQMPGRT
jgi:hypothetical protein